jgi:hypothetical protein
MTCKRCHGLATKERIYEFLENDGQVYLGGWRWVSRCHACGNVADWVVDQNRQIVNSAVVVAS